MRCYNGCPDSKLKAWMDEQDRLRKILAVRGLRATYFPAEERFMVFTLDHRAVTDFCNTLEEAVRKTENHKGGAQ